MIELYDARKPEAAIPDAEWLADRARTTYGERHLEYANAINNLATIYFDAGREEDAEQLARRSLEIREKALDASHPSVAHALTTLAEIYRKRGRANDAEPLSRRALAIFERDLGKDHQDTITATNNLAAILDDLERWDEAAAYLKQVLIAREALLEPTDPRIATAADNLADVNQDLGLFRDAIELRSRALAIRQHVLGPDHPDTAATLSNLATLYQDNHNLVEAEQLYKRAISILEKAHGQDHRDLGPVLGNLAGLYFSRGEFDRSEQFMQRAADNIIRRVRRVQATARQALSGKGNLDVAQLSNGFRRLVKVQFRLAAADPSRTRELQENAFQIAQWATSSDAAAALAQMGARQTKSGDASAELVREHQDLTKEWQERDSVVVNALVQPPDETDAVSLNEQRQRLAAIDARIVEIEAALQKTSPDYAALTSASPLPLADVQADLRDDEVLLMTLETPTWDAVPAESFIWVVTKDDVKWVRSNLGGDDLKREVAALRCGLDYEGAWLSTGSSCPQLTGVTYTDADFIAGKPLPFDVSRAHDLYRSLLGEASGTIDGKRNLLVVPSGALTQLPFQVLVTKATTADEVGSSNVPWLITSHAITVLPAVSSLKALRRQVRISQATNPYLGIGNPLLDGPDGSYAQLKALARANTNCVSVGTALATESAAWKGLAPMAQRGGIADADELRKAAPLPETADELCNVAKSLGAGEADVMLGERASETGFKHLSGSGALRNYKTLHFATHGALSGEVSGSAEPGLLLTPPSAATEADDGYLAASEIAGLKLDADWVILSACNTAAGGADNAEALSGLARAFIYAGARSLLVSHWYVNSQATVGLINGTFEALSADPRLGRASALQRSMMKLIKAGSPPSDWAPFVVVGEGSPGR